MLRNRMLIDAGCISWNTPQSGEDYVCSILFFFLRLHSHGRKNFTDLIAHVFFFLAQNFLRNDQKTHA